MTEMSQLIENRRQAEINRQRMEEQAQQEAIIASRARIAQVIERAENHLKSLSEDPSFHQLISRLKDYGGRESAILRESNELRLAFGGLKQLYVKIEFGLPISLAIYITEHRQWRRVLREELIQVETGSFDPKESNYKPGTLFELIDNLGTNEGILDLLEKVFPGIWRM